MTQEKMNFVKSEVFRHGKFGNLRTMVDAEGEIWFVGKVVAEALGYARGTNVLSQHIDPRDSKLLIYKACTDSVQASGIWQGNDYSNKVLINESGLYSLVLSSKLPQAREFKHWVTSEVLPQIRKTGGYIPVQQEDDEKTILCKAGQNPDTTVLLTRYCKNGKLIRIGRGLYRKADAPTLPE